MKNLLGRWPLEARIQWKIAILEYILLSGQNLVGLWGSSNLLRKLNVSLCFSFFAQW